MAADRRDSLDLESARLEAKTAAGDAAVKVSGSGMYRCGPLEIDLKSNGEGFSWTAVVDRPIEVTSVSLVWDVGPAGERVTVFCNGYQSWSRAGRAILGETEDPSRAPDSIDLTRAMYHADPSIAGEGELRSELVTVVDLGTHAPLIGLGFEDAGEHDGTFRLRRAGDRIEVRAEAFLDGARLHPGELRALHSVALWEGDSAPILLEEWAAVVGDAVGARIGGEYQVGWCSWYQYFHDLSERNLLDNLALSADWPFDLFQTDDGYQAQVGDWLHTNDRFSSGLDALASTILRAGRRPGIWIAPFLASPESELAKNKPELLASTIGVDMPLIGMVNPGWGGITYVLDTTKPETIAHLEKVVADLVSAGFGYIKIDFAYAPSLPGRYADPSLTPAQRVGAGLRAIRRGAGPDVFLLGCGCPLGPAIGIVDGMRIGPDVAPSWEPEGDQFIPPGYELEVPSTKNAWRNTLARSFMHRRLWLNDPDCIMLRTAQTRMSRDAVRAWALAVAASGGVCIVSDDLALLDTEARALLDEVVAIGQKVDRESATGPPPRCDDLMENAVPTRLTSASVGLVADPTKPTAVLAQKY